MKPIPDNLQPPEGAVILGWGETFKVPHEGRFSGWSYETPNLGWERSGLQPLNGLRLTWIYAAPADSEVVRINQPFGNPGEFDNCDACQSLICNDLGRCCQPDMHRDLTRPGDVLQNPGNVNTSDTPRANSHRLRCTGYDQIHNDAYWYSEYKKIERELAAKDAVIAELVEALENVKVYAEEKRPDSLYDEKDQIEIVETCVEALSRAGKEGA